MKTNKTLQSKLVLFGLALTAVLFITACNSDNNSTDSTMNDTAMSDENMMNNTVNSNDTNHMLNDSTNNDTEAVDEAFVTKVAEINMEEIKLGKLAQQKGSMAHVKELGKMMVAEHTQVMKGIVPIAKSKMISLPSAESQKIKDAYQTLNAKTGKEFDKAYSDMMVDGHKEAIDLFEKTNSETNNADLKAMTASMIPVLKTHLEHAEICQKESKKM